jgi:glutathionyl-hydroquinone reductase
MGLLVQGEWRDEWYDTSETKGRFKRTVSQFRGWVREDPTSCFPAASGRYHLYVSYACPWAHRTLIFRELKGLESVIGVSTVHPLMLEHGWSFSEPFSDPLGDRRHLFEVYQAADPKYTGRVTVPILWDREKETIVSNESADIIRMLNREFDTFGDASVDLCPSDLNKEIERINDYIYRNINNGVYKAGFATTQDAYEEAVWALFDALDVLEERMATQAFLVGDGLTEADVRLFTTLIRFDAVYSGHFKCNLRPFSAYPNLLRHTRDLYSIPGIAETCRMDHIKQHYYGSHPSINPSGVVPVGPDVWP